MLNYEILQYKNCKNPCFSLAASNICVNKWGLNEYKIGLRHPIITIFQRNKIVLYCYAGPGFHCCSTIKNRNKFVAVTCFSNKAAEMKSDINIGNSNRTCNKTGKWIKQKVESVLMMKRAPASVCF